MQPEARFGSRVLRPGPGQELRALACRAMAAALDAVEPAAAVERWVRRDGDVLEVGARRYRLSDYERIFVVGAGKAGAPMAAAVERVLRERLTAGLVTVKLGYAGPTRLVTLREGGHPLPDAASVAGGRAIEELLSETTERDLVVCLLSGGGSALLTLPEAPVSLEDFQRLTELLLRAGATINELNAVRKHLDAVKGGGLARMAQPAEVVTLILSDVVGNPLDVIASGPTVPDTTTFADAWEVVERFGLVERLPASVASRLRAGLVGTVPETPKPGDAALARVQNVVIASNEQAAEAALRQAESDGLHALLLTTFLEGEAREVGRVVSALARGEAANATPLARPACLILGGETTVTVRGDGRGGRNQELALAAAFPIQGLPEVLIASLATDGTDGPTDAAGAMVDGTTLARAGRAGLDPRAALERNDAYPFFERLGDLLVTGPTNTNVNDLVLVLVR